MDFYRQLDLLVTIVVTVIVFGYCIFYGNSVTASLLIAAAVFLTGLLVGRRLTKLLEILSHM